MVERWLPDHPTPEEEPAVRDTPRPTPTRDLDDESEIAEMVRRFYADVAQDDLLGPMFNDVAQVDWSEHLPKLTAFWSRALLGRSGYAGNPFRAHALVHAQEPFRSEEHTSELQSLMRNSYAVFCLKKKKKTTLQLIIDQQQIAVH